MPQSRRLCGGRALPRKTGIFRGTAAFEEPMNQAETPPKTVTAWVLIIGNEIQSGRTQDANLAFLAKGVNEAGILLREARVIPDDADTIVNTVNEVRRVFDYVFTTGGSGPTHDDITSAAIAKDLGELQARYADLEIGSYPYFRRRDFGVTLVIRGTVRERIGAAVEELKTLIRSLGGDPQEGAAEEEGRSAAAQRPQRNPSR